jgi:hypothetical protein
MRPLNRAGFADAAPEGNAESSLPTGKARYGNARKWTASNGPAGFAAKAKFARIAPLLVCAAASAADFATCIAGLDIEAVLPEPVDQSQLRQCIAAALASGKGTF